jgi:3-oxoacyl-[acyl-carrier-protein] synthase I
MMNRPLGIRVAGVGMITPVGANTAMTMASVQAGISCYQNTGFYNDRDKPMVTTCVPEEALPDLNEELQWIGLSGREKRIVRLAEPALQEVLKAYPLDDPLPLFLAGPEALPGSAKQVTGKILGHFIKQTGANIDIGSSRYFATGRVGILDAIGLAFKYFSSVDAPYLLVGGVDSYLDVAILGQLDAENRVLAENNNDAFAPGEGAAFLLLEPIRSPDQYQHIPVLYEPGFGVEHGHRYSDNPYQGQGLSDAFRSALTSAEESKVSAIYSSMNGENFFSKELGVATMRNAHSFAEGCAHHHPADCYGDIGAATAGVLIALAQQYMMKSTVGTQALVYCSADQSSRSAICIGRKG